MSELDEIEKRATHCLDDMWTQYHDLARFIRLALPVIKAAAELTDDNSDDAELIGNVHSAISKMREELK